jgi:hypothetical protein
MYPCTNRDDGCPEVRPMHLILEHEVNCSFRNYKCPFSEESMLSCARYYPLDDLKRHVVSDHRVRNLDDYGGGGFNGYLEPLKPTGRFDIALVVFGELFYAVWKLIEGQFRCNVMYIGPKNNCSNYTYRFTVTARNKVETFSMCLLTQSYNDNFDDVLKPGNCMTINNDTIQKFFVEENKLPFRFEISRLGEAHDGLPLKEQGDTQCDEL